MFDAYIFDLDGTLLDTLDDLTDATNAALNKFGCPLRSREEVREFVGNGIRTLIRRAVSEGERHPRFEEIFAAFGEYYGAHCLDKTKPYRGISELLGALKERGAKIAIVSNKADFAVKKLSKRYFGALVSAAVGENEGAGIRKKPAPDSVFSVLRLLGAEKEKAVYIGDSDVDIQTAANAGLPCISVAWGFRTREFLLEHGARLFAERPEDILSF